jgi:hypothetical protein
MKSRSRFTSKHAASADTHRLIELANHLSQASCKVEDRYWESRLEALICQLLSDHDEITLSSALDRLSKDHAPAYGALISTIENCAECKVDSSDGDKHIVLIALPMLAWSRYSIPSSTLSSDTLDSVRAQLHGHILSKNAQLGLLNHLFSPDQLPQSFSETYALLQRMSAPALKGKHEKLDGSALEETVKFLSDTRYILGAVAIPQGEAIFRWQEEAIPAQTAQKQWVSQMQGIVASLLPACSFQLLAPTAFHAAVRDADRESRPYSVQVAVEYLKAVLNCTPDALQASIGAFYDKRLEEYRIGFSRRNDTDVLHGIVWPILEQDDESPDALSAIEDFIRGLGVRTINVLNHQFPVEFCDDCGAPLFPNSDGEPMHAQMPDDIEGATPQSLH